MLNPVTFKLLLLKMQIICDNHPMKLGILYIVATPIGNLEDITYRAIKILQSVDLIAAEDTRHSKRLLQHYAISTPILSLHDYNEEKKSAELLRKLQDGIDIALISDAGTPLISDPGYHLITTVRKAGIDIVPIPGPCAAITALCAAGLSTVSFVFEGFLPVKEQALKAKLAHLAHETRTIIIYEAPHRLLRLLAFMAEIFGQERKTVLAKELTKLFENIKSGTIQEIQTWLNEDARRQQGEFVILIEGASDKKIAQELSQDTLEIFHLLQSELPTIKAAKITAKITGVAKQKILDFEFEGKND